MNGLTRGLFLALCLICATPQAEDEQRDFYAEPGLNPFATASGQDATEHIDPFSGNLQRSYVDLFLPVHNLKSLVDLSRVLTRAWVRSAPPPHPLGGPMIRKQEQRKWK